MWDLIVSVPDHCLSFYFSIDILYFFLFTILGKLNTNYVQSSIL